MLDVWPPLPPAGVLRRPRPPSALPFPLAAPGCGLYSRARHALWHGARRLAVEPGDEALVPAFHHGSEIEALVRAGLSPRFYEGGRRLEPVESELEALLGPSTRILHLTHYLGLPQDGERWRRWAHARGLALIEDAAQAWLATHGGRPVGGAGDLSVFCLYKTFGLPDGAAAIGGSAPAAAGRSPGRGVAKTIRLVGRWVAGRAPGRPPRRPAPPYDPGRDFAVGDPWSPPSSATRWLLRRVVDGSAAERRRERYGFLADRFGELVPEEFADPDGGASPFAFPLRVRPKAEVVAALRRRGIHALNLWTVPHPSLPVAAFPRAARLRASVIGLPVHQELRRSDLERIVSEVRRALDG